MAGANGNAAGHSAGAVDPRVTVIAISFHVVRDAWDNLLPIAGAMAKTTSAAPWDGRRYDTATRGVQFAPMKSRLPISTPLWRRMS